MFIGGLHRVLKPKHSPVAVMAREFVPDLVAEGIPPAALEAAVRRLERVYYNPRPRGVTAPFVPDVFTFDADGQNDGRARATAEWLARDVRLYTPTPVPRLTDDRGRIMPAQLDTAAAIPLTPVSGGSDNQRLASMMAGHNAEMWARLRHLPDGSEHPFAWTRDIFDLRGLWRRRGKEGVDSAAAAAPDGSFHGIAWEDRSGFFCTGTAVPNGGIRLRLPDAWTGGRSRRVLWGPLGSAVLYVRSGPSPHKDGAVLLYAIDLRTGTILNAEAE